MTDTDSTPVNTPTSEPIRGAGFWVRLTAHAIDMAIVFLLGCGIFIPVMFRMVNMMDSAQGEMNMREVIPLWVEIPVDLLLLLGILFLWRYAQTTPGKKLFGLRIVDGRTGGKPGWWQLIRRYVGYIIAMVPIPLKLFAPLVPGVDHNPSLALMFSSWLLFFPLMLGFLWIFVDRYNRGWHDLMSRTIVISAEQEAIPQAPVADQR